MIKCSKCIFYKENGCVDMGCHIPECQLIVIDELRKKNNNQKYDLFNSLITNELKAQQCKHFTLVSEIVDIIKERKK